MADNALDRLLELVKPDDNFSLRNVPEPPDYNLKDNWLALPDSRGYELLVPSTNYELVNDRWEVLIAEMDNDIEIENTAKKKSNS